MDDTRIREVLSAPSVEAWNFEDPMARWHPRFLDMARMVATWSKDPNTQMGAVIVSHDRRFITTGYNGFPRGIRDDKRLLDRELKRKMVVHAEANAVYNCPWDPHKIDSTIYITGQPCGDCAKAIIQAGIKKVVYLRYDFTDHWAETMMIAQQLLLEAGVELIEVEEGDQDAEAHESR
jgi:dCMP deaminase